MTTKTKKRKKKTSEAFLRFSRRLVTPFRRLTFVTVALALVGFALLAGAPARAWPGAPQTTPHAHDFVVFTTVFTSQGFTLPGARVRIRRENDKKFRWEAISDRRGELAIRVPQNSDYEMMVEARGYMTQTHKVAATEGNRADLTIRMEPLFGPHSESGTGGKS
jgi:glycogen debranching enzyme